MASFDLNYLLISKYNHNGVRASRDGFGRGEGTQFRPLHPFLERKDYFYSV